MKKGIGSDHFCGKNALQTRVVLLLLWLISSGALASPVAKSVFTITLPGSGTAPIIKTASSLTFIQTACEQNFNVLTSLSAVGSGAIDAASVQVISQPTNGTVLVKTDGIISFQSTATSGIATFIVRATSTLTDTLTQRFVTSTNLIVSNNLACEPIPLATFCPIDNRNNITSVSLSDFATLTQNPSLGETTIKATLNGTGQPGDLAGFIISNPTLYSTTAVPTYTVNTYLGNNSVVRDSKTVTGLSDIQLLPSGLQEVSFQTTQSFDRVELIITNTSNTSLLNKIYYGFSKPATVYYQREISIRFDRPATCIPIYVFRQR